MRVILIDPVTQEVTETDIGGGLQPLYDKLGCSLVEPVNIHPSAVLWVDEEGLLKGVKNGFTLGTYPQPLAGRGILSDIDENGSIAGTDIVLKTIKDQVEWITF